MSRLDKPWKEFFQHDKKESENELINCLLIVHKDLKVDFQPNCQSLSCDDMWSSLNITSEPLVIYQDQIRFHLDRRSMRTASLNLESPFVNYLSNLLLIFLSRSAIAEADRWCKSWSRERVLKEFESSKFLSFLSFSKMEFFDHRQHLLGWINQFVDRYSLFHNLSWHAHFDTWDIIQDLNYWEFGVKG